MHKRTPWLPIHKVVAESRLAASPNTAGRVSART